MTDIHKIKDILDNDNREIFIEIRIYLFKNTVRTRNKKIVCNLVKELYNGLSELHITPEKFEHSRKIMKWIRNASIDLITYYFHKALQDVFGQEYSDKIQIRITK